MMQGQAEDFNDEFDRHIDRIRILTEDRNFDTHAFGEAVIGLVKVLFADGNYHGEAVDADCLVTARITLADFISAREST